MGTRSLTLLLDHDGTHLASIYRQFDGYPEGHGKALAALANRKVVNGIGEGFHPDTHANSYCELGAKIITGLKNEDKTGNIYLSRIKSMDDDLGWADYLYRIRSDGTGEKEGLDLEYGQPIIECYEVRHKSGLKLLCAIHPADYETWLEGYLNSESDQDDEQATSSDASLKSPQGDNPTAEDSASA